MGDIDPDTLLEWLTVGAGDERDMQVIALEQLCMLLLMSDNVDRCFESCPPRSFLPALCHIFMDETAPDNILEVTARAITYYLDVSAECSRRIVTVDGAVKALCTRLVVVDITSRTSKDLAEQCVKVLELMCTREAGAIYEAGGLNCMLTFIREYGSQIHKDTLHSAMSVVARLCSKMEPTDETLEDCMDSLSKLLQHEDTYVADTSLKCFACLADRFTRRGVDPAPLAKHGLTEELLKKLVSSALACGINTSSSLNTSMSESRSGSGNVSIIVSVLSMLCRGSPSITHDLLRSNLPDAIETAMNGEERCVLDTMRLVDLLLILLFEGRDALPKSSLTTTRGTLGLARKLDSSGDKTHRQLIDCIRSKDTDALTEAVDSSQIDVNFMDDVGQTLLNWAAAFGTLEMVEYLCERGADVNRGQRSSSLHYAACFGRPAVAKVLLKYGANPELRDDDGKTPLDKARERNDEGHKEVVRILQSPGEWLAIGLESAEKTPSITTNTAATTTDASTTDGGAQTDEDKEKTDGKNDTETESDTIPVTADTAKPDECDKEEDKKEGQEEQNVKGDPEMAPVYVKRLVPVFANTFQASLIPSVKKATLSILKKMIQFIPASMMNEVASGSVASQLVDVIAVALNVEDDDESHLTAFHCIHDLMSKGASAFLIHFIRLGVLQKISEMASESEELNQDQLIDGKIETKAEVTVPEDATDIAPGLPYHWHDWCIVRGRDCLYFWSDFCAIELSNGSNGWFRFVLDGKLATMYSSGSPEGGTSSSESRTEFLDKLQRARTSVPTNSASRPILSATGTDNIVIGNWTLSCRQERQLTIVNTDSQQATILKEELPGFLFESNRGTKHTFTAEISLGPDFAFSWSGKPGKKFQSRKDQIRQKLSSLAHGIYYKYFKDADLTPHGSMATLMQISKTMNECVQSNDPLLEGKKILLHDALKQLCDIFVDEPMLSSYEIQTSGLVTALNNCLNKTLPLSSSLSLVKEHTFSCEVFKKIFGDPSRDVSSDESLHFTSPAVILVRKLIMVLESSERLPVWSYENAGGGSGLQALLRRLRFKLERGNRSLDFINRTGKCIKMEALTTIGEVQSYLLKMVAKQWYDYERTSFHFFKLLKDNNSEAGISFEHQSDFDENGVLYWLGTNGKSNNDWVNPARHGILLVSSSEGRSLPYGRLEDIISRDSAPVNCHTNDNKNAWFTFDLGVNLIPSAYTLRHARGYGRSALRNWLFQVSKDGVGWATLKAHENDSSLQEPGSTFTWKIDLAEEYQEDKEGWHFVRIQQNGPNASGQTHYLSISGFEIYGKVTSVLEQMKPLQTPETYNNQKKQRRIYRSQILRHMALSAKCGPDWKSLHEQARLKALGSNPDYSENQEAENRGKNENNKKSQSTLDNTLKKVVLSFGKRNDNIETNSNNSEGNNKTQDDRNEEDKPSDAGIDMANLQFLMAVEDLLDSSSSDLVANALAEAASLRVDQLRLATQSFRNTLLASSKSRPTPSAQGSRESQSPPSEMSIPIAKETVPESKDTESTEKTVTDTNESEKKVSSDVIKFSTLKDECVTQLQKISSSMSDVLDSMPLPSETGERTQTNELNEANVEFCEAPTDSELTVAENNFLNDNHNAMETNVISIFNDDDVVEDDDYSDSDSESDDARESQSESKRRKEQQIDAEKASAVISTNTLKSSPCIMTSTEDKLGEVPPHVAGDVISEEDLVSIIQNLTGGSGGDQGDSSGLTRQALRLLSGESVTKDKDDKTAGEKTKNLNDINKQPKEADIPRPHSPSDEYVEIDTSDQIISTPVKPSDNITSGVVVMGTSLGEEENITDLPKSEIVEQTSNTEQDKTDSNQAKDGEQESSVEVENPVMESTTIDEDNEMYTLEEILQVEKLVAKMEGKKETDQKKTETAVEEMEVDDDEDDDDDDDDFDDIENEDENETEEFYEPVLKHEQHYDHHRRVWDDDLVLKCQHDALVPAFDPRPGRTNIPQTQDIEIPKDEQKSTKEKKDVGKIRLFLRGTPYPNNKEIEIPLENPQATIFSYVQMLVLHGTSSVNHTERLRRAWEPNFTIVYKSMSESTSLDDELSQVKENNLVKWQVSYVREKIGTEELPKTDVINYLQQNSNKDFLTQWKLTGRVKICRKQRNCSSLVAAYKDFVRMRLDAAKSSNDDTKEEKSVQIEEPVHRSLDGIAPIQQVLDVIKSLHRLTDENESNVFLPDENIFDVPNDEFLCKKLTNKLVQQIQDPLTLASGSLPLWCEYLVINYPTLFPFETRQMFFRATAFGCSRSIVWLQSIQEATTERSRVHLPRRLEAQESRIGRLKHERVTVPRGEELLETAIRLMDFHAERKSVLEIEFKDEEGTGLGPSLEFYALVSTTLQKNDLKLWVSMDQMTDVGQSGYSHHVNGLFPAPLPQDSVDMERICCLFSFLGIFLAKCLQDNRLIDIPLSSPFFKMLCASKGKYSRLSRTLSQTSDVVETYSDCDEESVDEVFDAEQTSSVEKLDSHYFSDVITDLDFELIHPNKAKFMKQLKVFVEKRKSILCDRTLDDSERKRQLDEVMFLTENGMECKIEDLGLTFQYIPPSTVYGFDAVDLKPGGADEVLTSENVEEYMELLVDFTMHKGIAMQLEAFRAGFNRVFPMEKLHAFKPREVRLMLCGEQTPKWTFDELLMYTEPKYGYHKESPGFIRLLNVLVAMNGQERKEFLQFATGCSSLPPGGISNLHPRLTVVKKEGESDGSYPSVNTCVHYLKLPEYSSEEVLREKLLAATREKGFHLN